MEAWERGLLAAQLGGGVGTVLMLGRERLKQVLWKLRGGINVKVNSLLASPLSLEWGAPVSDQKHRPSFPF